MLQRHNNYKLIIDSLGLLFHQSSEPALASPPVALQIDPLASNGESRVLRSSDLVDKVHLKRAHWKI